LGRAGLAARPLRQPSAAEDRVPDYAARSAPAAGGAKPDDDRPAHRPRSAASVLHVQPRGAAARAVQAIGPMRRRQEVDEQLDDPEVLHG